MTQKFSAARPLTDEEEAEVQAMIAEDPDNPELTDQQVAEMRPFREIFPEMAAAIDLELAKQTQPSQELSKRVVSIRLDQDVIDKFKATGPDWQSRINEVLRAAKVEAA